MTDKRDNNGRFKPGTNAGPGRKPKRDLESQLTALRPYAQPPDAFELQRWLDQIVMCRGAVEEARKVHGDDVARELEELLSIRKNALSAMLKLIDQIGS